MAFSEQVYRGARSYRRAQLRVPEQRLWHGYRLSQEERGQLDRLMGRALMDTKFCQQLLERRDSAVFAGYGLSDETQRWLCSIEASSLTELAQAISCA